MEIAKHVVNRTPIFRSREVITKYPLKISPKCWWDVCMEIAKHVVKVSQKCCSDVCTVIAKHFLKMSPNCW